MKRRHKRAAAHVIALAPKNLAGRVMLGAMLMAAFALIVVSHASPSTRSLISAPIVDSVMPVLDVLSRPASSLERFAGWAQSLANIHAQNQQLREANARLMQWQQVALRLEAENVALRELLHYSSRENLKFTTAKVISDRGGPFARTVLVNAGLNFGIETGQPVINADGMVGRVVESAEHSARVLLLTDINSRIPVITENSRERSIASGNNTDMLTLLYLADDTKVAVGEKLVTSGDGATVPAGLPVGEIVAVESGSVKVRPYANWFRLEYISAIRNEGPIAGEELNQPSPLLNSKHP